MITKASLLAKEGIVMVEGKKLGLVGRVVLGAGAVGGLVSGCSDYGNAVSRNVGEYALMEGVAGSVRNEVEGPRGTTVNVGDGGYIPSEKIYRMVLRKYNDLDGDGFISNDETDFIKHNSAVDLSKYGVVINVLCDLNVTYSMMNLDGKVIKSVTSNDGVMLPRGTKIGYDVILIHAKVDGSERPLRTNLKIMSD